MPGAFRSPPYILPFPFAPPLTPLTLFCPNVTASREDRSKRTVSRYGPTVRELPTCGHILIQSPSLPNLR